VEGTTEYHAGDRYWVKALIVLDFPAVSLPSNTTAMPSLLFSAILLSFANNFFMFVLSHHLARMSRVIFHLLEEK